MPSGAIPKPVWLWHSQTGLDPAMVDLCWQAFLRRFDIEHTFRMLKQTLGWTCPKLRTPEQGDRWTWLVLAAYTQLRLARDLITDLRRPWEKAARPGRPTPARVRRGFRHIRTTIGSPAAAPKHSRPGPGRPAGRPNHRPATRHDVHVVTTTDTRNPATARQPSPAPHDHAEGVKTQAKSPASAPSTSTAYATKAPVLRRDPAQRPGRWSGDRSRGRPWRPGSGSRSWRSR